MGLHVGALYSYIRSSMNTFVLSEVKLAYHKIFGSFYSKITDLLNDNSHLGHMQVIITNAV